MSESQNGKENVQSSGSPSVGNINNNMSTLEKQVDFSDFKTFVQSLSDYNSPDKGTQQDCYDECVAFISLLPSFILKDTSNMNFNTRSIDFMQDLQQDLQKDLTKILENKTSKKTSKQKYCTSQSKRYNK